MNRQELEYAIVAKKRDIDDILVEQAQLEEKLMHAATIEQELYDELAELEEEFYYLDHPKKDA